MRKSKKKQKGSLREDIRTALSSSLLTEDNVYTPLQSSRKPPRQPAFRAYRSARLFLAEPRCPGGQPSPPDSPKHAPAPPPALPGSTEPVTQRGDTRRRPRSGGEARGRQRRHRGRLQETTPRQARPRAPRGAEGQAGTDAGLSSRDPLPHLGPAGLQFPPPLLLVHVAGEPGARRRQPGAGLAPASTVTPEGAPKFRSWPPLRLRPARLGCTTSRGAAARSASQ